MSVHINNPEVDAQVLNVPQPKDPDAAADRIVDAIRALGETLETNKIDHERIPGMVKENTVWDVYNNEARKVDTELVKDWTANLNSLLLFAAIFAAVLTAFIIESKKMLEQDQTELLVDMTILYFGNIGNLSNVSFVRPTFEPTSTAISINCLLFASLGASLSAALATVVSLQWVADYDAAITRGGSSPEDRARRRQFRHAGVIGWKMREIIAFLPLLLYTSVILFWAGAILWMSTLNRAVGYVVVGGTTIAVLFYGSTTLLAVVYVSAPFRTPLSRGIYWVSLRSISVVGQLLLRLPIDRVIGCLTLLGRRFSSSIRQVNISVHPPSSGVSAETLSPLHHPDWTGPITTWIKTHFFPNPTSRYREDEFAKGNPTFNVEALVWLAHQLPISAESYHRLITFVTGMLSLPAEASPSCVLEKPWPEILEFLSWYYMRKIFDSTLSEADCKGLDTLLQCNTHPVIRSTITPTSNYEEDPHQSKYWKQCRFKAGAFPEPQAIHSKGIPFLLVRDAPTPSPGAKHELEATMRFIKWRNSEDWDLTYHLSGWEDVLGNIEFYSSAFLQSCLHQFGMAAVMPNATSSFYRANSDRIRWRTDWHRIFSETLVQVLMRELVSGEALALAQVYEGWVTQQVPRISEEFTPESVTQHPLLYAKNLAWFGKRYVDTHYTVTFLVARVASSLVKASQSREARGWARWVEMMLWIGATNNEDYWDILLNNHVDGEDPRTVDTKPVDLWGKVDMSWRVSSEYPHFYEILEILETLRSGLGNPGPLWISTTKGEDKPEQVMQIVEAFDEKMETETTEELHRALVHLLCDDMSRADERWPSPVTLEDDEARGSTSANISRRLFLVRDPCLAMLGGFACGIVVSVELGMTKIYIDKHRRSLEFVALLLYKHLSVNDPPAVWQLRAALLPTKPYEVDRLGRLAFLHPLDLTHLELIFQNQTYCSGHSLDVGHILFHLFLSTGLYWLWVRFRGSRVLFGGVYLETLRLQPMLAILALCDTQDLSDLDFGANVNTECTERIWETSKAVKKQRRNFLILLKDITTELVDKLYFDQDTAIILLESIQQAIYLPEDEASVPLWRPLALAVRRLRARLIDRRGEGSETVALHTQRVFELLHAKADETLHHNTLACARSPRNQKPARAWLPMYID